MKFTHIGDCHLGGWRQPELRELNFKCFQHVIKTSIKEKVDFMLVAGDLFDSAYPSIETIKEAFGEFRKLKEAKIPVFLIAGSHDYSASGKTFLDVLEKAGFIENVFKPEYKDDDIILQPTIYKDVAIYGYPGKKSGMEVQEIPRIKLQEAPGFFTILMLHTTLRDAIGSLPIPAVDPETLPQVDHIALAHLHTQYQKQNRVYCGPTFPNNATELEDLGGGSFYIFNSGTLERRVIKLKEVISLNIQISDALTATDGILNELKNHNFKDKIIILKLHGILERGNTSDINFEKIRSFSMASGAFVFLKNTTKLTSYQTEINLETDSENIEEEIIMKFQEENPSKFNSLIPQLVSTLQTEKKEDEKNQIFEDRIISESRKILKM
jgi:DNA repair protein SbcD/Mre11